MILLLLKVPTLSNQILPLIQIKINNITIFIVIIIIYNFFFDLEPVAATPKR